MEEVLFVSSKPGSWIINKILAQTLRNMESYKLNFLIFSWLKKWCILFKEEKVVNNQQLLRKVTRNTEFLKPNYPTNPSSSKTGKASTRAAGCFLFTAVDTSPVGWSAKRGQQVLDWAASALLALLAKCCSFAVFAVSSALCRNMSSTENWRSPAACRKLLNKARL